MELALLPEDGVESNGCSSNWMSVSVFRLAEVNMPLTIDRLLRRVQEADFLGSCEWCQKVVKVVCNRKL